MRQSLSDCVTRLLHILWQCLSPEASLFKCHDYTLHASLWSLTQSLHLYADLEIPLWIQHLKRDFPSLNHCFFIDITLTGASCWSPSSTNTDTIQQFSDARSIGHVPRHVHSIGGGQFDFRRLTYTKVNPIPSNLRSNPAITPRSSQNSVRRHMSVSQCRAFSLSSHQATTDQSYLSSFAFMVSDYDRPGLYSP
ncbi:uncharacterized protein FPRO_09010 [Fusarium proliferatum ET1]|uniref:Uncharacterized protein n=1 Tax=Fusarium proliferatum (strain ET1) TaxID=1227346 RepID=A0A1L7W9G5_FUSPR|nr:uncharacterized protein FPRO_09010 [Fusarium proliferatum ET1]CZR49249.1 uncharacterized protein FPRO_09010 [Fusarium proliferatum ET1]